MSKRLNKQTQTEMIINRLMTEGNVSRNWALKNYIGRLASRMTDLKDDGWIFSAKNEKTDWGVDFVYYLVISPLKKVEYRLPDGTIVGTKYERK